METNTTYPIDLITRYLAGEAEGDDLVFLEKWLKANPDNQKVFNDYRKTWEVMEASRVAEQVDVDLAWEEFESERENYSDQPVSDFSFRLGGRRITLTPSRVLRYAAIFFLLSIPSIILFHYYTKPETKILQAGQALVESTLPDGSLVTLNAGSHLEYPAVFDHLKRGVQLRGEAYFEVTHNTGKPFVIYYNNARVEVLGTRFYVNTNAEDGKMEVVLKEGSVSVYFKNRPNESVTLTPGEKAEITPDQTAIRKRMNDDENYLAWKNPPAYLQQRRTYPDNCKTEQGIPFRDPDQQPPTREVSCYGNVR